MINTVRSLDGEFGVDGQKAEGDGNKSSRAVAVIGITMRFEALADVGATTEMIQKTPRSVQI